MKQFNLAEYLQLKNEGKEPRIVTRDGRSARIICADRKHTKESTIALIDNGFSEILTTHFDNGEFYENSENDKDLFFADLEEEPKYRPYKDADEAYQEAVKHNSWCIDETGRYRHVDIITDTTFDCKKFHDVLALGWTWADDGSPCGVKED